MELEQTRVEIAEALDGLGGVIAGHTRRPDVVGEGDAWPMWSGASEGVPGVAWLMRWRVLLVLPADEAAAEAWIAEHADDLLDALLPVAYVEGFEPVRLTTDAGDQLALQINLRRE